jgi:hypothetical protein
MENSMFKNLSRMEVCLRMATICQKAADESLPGIEQEKFQIASDKFRDEAGDLAIQDLYQALLAPQRFH